MTLDLVDAFRALAPLLEGAHRINAVQQEAARVLRDELQSLARRVRAPDTDRDEAVAIVLLRLVQAGPRGAREGDPDTDCRVRGFLRRALRNALHDIREAQNDEIFIEEDPAGSDPTPEEIVDRQERHQSIADARALLFGPILSSAAEKLRARDRTSFHTSVEELRRLGDDEITMEQLVEAESDRPDRQLGEEEFRTIRNRIYKRHQRAREVLFATVDDGCMAGTVPPELEEDVRNWLQWLRRR